ncbi:N-acetylmuramoyl-L-alanine amidase [Streptomyces sp. JJ66]|uniref:N-acetylmuramoyl-L-alanine amidase n=1 Tax=Streptomyces sp. JJ66 TaxID=2803843 RepID=UPI001C55CCB3|nr:N-acetylmuramoyl-L-alanine amidase [Streptomyces sp. JJ66]MBW1603476.1 N-acetylmuramoyl-L-alanine amidase [Streptomyces sp. JJ66]
MTPARRGFVAVAVLLPLCLLGAVAWLLARGGERPAPSPTTRPASPPGKVAPQESGEPGADGPLRGAVVVLDPGHNPGNGQHPQEMARLVDAGNHRKPCDTAGASTQDGYAEAEFTLDVARAAQQRLQALGATVRLTQNGDRPFGPCVDERARIGNEAEADAVVSVHADGAGPGQRGFHVILPAEVNEGSADTRAVTAPSRALGEHLVTRFASATDTEPARYLGPRTAASGLDVRDDLAGLNLTTVPKVFLECGNLRDSADAALLTDSAWRERAGHGIADGIAAYLADGR